MLKTLGSAILKKIFPYTIFNKIRSAIKKKGQRQKNANIDGKDGTKLKSSFQFHHSDKVTAVFTSCGRFDFLHRTINSFLKFNTYDIEKIIVVDNSTLPHAEKSIRKILNTVLNKSIIIINNENIGQVASIDKAYSLIETDYIYHSEDDWEFFNSGFIELSLDVLKFNSKIININTRIRFDGEKGSMHPLSKEKFVTPNGTIYHEFILNYMEEWHGFSWNPGLRRLSDYKSIMPYKKHGNEQNVGLAYKKMGYKAACLENFYNKHIGTNSITFKANM